MLRYFDKAGMEISKDQWHELTLTPKYQHVDLYVLDKFDIKTSWCGVYMDKYEPKPRLFLSEVRNEGNILESKWTSTLKEAEDCHKDMLSRHTK